MLKPICATIVCCCVSGLLWAHGGEDHGESKAARPLPGASVEAVQALSDGSLFVPKALQQQLGVRTGIYAMAEHPQWLALNGRIVADPNAGGRVQSLQAGRIVAGPKGLAVLGQKVRRGEVLAMLEPAISSLERAGQKSQLADLAARRSIAEKRLNRLEQLSGSVPQKEIDAARLELTALNQQQQAISEGLRGEALLAPVDGVISAANASLGQVVDARSTVFEVLDPTRLMVEALIPEALGSSGLRSASLSLGEQTLVLSFVGAGRTLQDLALPVLFRLPANNLMLAVGQPVRVQAETRERQRGVLLPASAIVKDSNGETRVWLHPEAERFVSLAVKAKPALAGQYLISSGLAGGERVVINGAQALVQWQAQAR